MLAEVHLPHDICTVNMSSTCDMCRRTFAKPFNLHRHKREVHGHISTDHNVLMSTYTVLQHPFTCIVAGCTQSGKTVWVKTLLENAQKTTSSSPQCTIWCDGQWQPSYFDMMKTMPVIEFNQGIPEDVDEPDHLDVFQCNLIVLDDLMAQSCKDKRIADLFTKRSHHRNLSVIFIVQNIFHLYYYDITLAIFLPERASTLFHHTLPLLEYLILPRRMLSF